MMSPTQQPSFVLGSKYRWNLPECDDQLVTKLASDHALSYAIAHVLATRGYVTSERITDLLTSYREKDVADPRLLKDAVKAVDRIQQAIRDQEKILVFGDYDVDGITSSALMMICLLPLGAQVNFFLPNRARDGYGLSTKIVERAARNGYSLIITVDNGITAFEPAAKARELGIDLIITDHHRPHDHVPDAYAIVNPAQEDCPYPFKYFAGVGVSFKVLSLLYEIVGKELPTKAYELLLLGTVADVVPLLGENRFWVRHGLALINAHESVSFAVLKQNGKLSKPTVTATDIGFNVTPQINALGRLEDPRQAVGFLVGVDKGQVHEVGQTLLRLNEVRKEIERAIFDDVQSAIDQKKIDITRENCIIAASKEWQPGVIGLVASRLVSAYGKPTILLHLTDSGLAKGSCRSIAEFNMFSALTSVKHLLEQFGGHSVAAGLALKQEQIPALKEALEKIISEQLEPTDLLPKITIDAPLSMDEIDKPLVHDLKRLEPFGNAHSEPIFMVTRVFSAENPVLLKNVHVRVTVACQKGSKKTVMFFNRPDVYEQLIELGNSYFDMAVRVNENHWNGSVTIQLIGVDIRYIKESV